jgi:hypothetical protein
VHRIGRRGAALLLGAALCADAARGLYGAAGSRDKRLVVLSSAAHGTNLLSLGGQAASARAVLCRFVAAHLGPTA